ncbi:GNAT family N-acetyltransferase [uncultured Cohaesibacter sp.]|uniref:GNAT family N-acetyltransferase n=1 Tax=uncultured Cohaesibacter sp. TaxID=1002546 RepID=UPI002930F665|nr:GNAT family N-acetyltransferase [uncultured Cohaesibacter sp.]
MIKGLEFSRARKSDLAELLELYKHLICEDPDLDLSRAEAILDQLNQMEPSAIYLARIKGRLVASATLVVIPNLTRNGAPYGLVENVVTHNDFRGQGIGRALLSHVTSEAWQHGCYKVMLMTGSQKHETLNFYRKCGFEPSKTGFQIRKIPARSE